MTAMSTELHCPPRYGTRRSPDRPTLGGRVAEIARQLGKEPMPHQQLIYDVAYELDPKTGYPAYDEVVVIGPRQVTGKAIDAVTPMLTTRGWVPLADVQVGDHVYHPDGHPVRVTFVAEDMIGHDCYRVTTSDGRTVVADAGHLWQVKDTHSGTRAWKTLTTAQIVSEGLRNRGAGGWRWRLPIQRAVKSPDVGLPLDPYFLGLWLGDGTSANSSLTVGDDDLPHVREQVVAAGLTVHSEKRDVRTGAWSVWVSSPRRGRRCSLCPEPDVSRGLCRRCYKRAAHAGKLPAKLPMDTPNTRLRSLGVIRNKHVPDLYLYAGHDQRLALLQGLMDSDGSIDKRQGAAEFCSTRRPLADAVLYLARSLGWRASMGESDARIDGRTVGTRWRVTWTPTTDGPSPFRLPRKMARIRPASTRSAGSLSAVSIASIEPVPTRPVKCIKVDSPDGLFLAGRDLIATHNTELIFPAMTHRCLGFGDKLVDWVHAELGHRVRKPGAQRVLYTAQTADNAREKWRDVHVARIEESVFSPIVKVRKRLNAEAIMWPNGSFWSPGSTTGKTGGTGDTLDMGVMDEYWSRENNRTELGMRPAMMTRPWRQLWKLSMIPGLARSQPGSWEPLRVARQNGRARCDADVRRRVAYFEWSMAPGMDPADPATWWTCMPALGVTVDEATVRSDFEALDLIDFKAEYLGWEPEAGAAKWSVISEATWNALKLPDLDPATRPLPYVEPVAFGVAAAPGQTSASIGMAARTHSGDTFIELIDRRPGITWTIDALASLTLKWSPCAIAVEAHGPAAPIIEPLKRELRDRNCDTQLVELQGPDTSKACAQFYTETGEVGEHDPDDETVDPDRRIRHLNDPDLNAAVAGAVKYTFNDQWRWQRQGAGGDPSALYAVTLARAAGERVEWIGGSYSIMDSLG